MLTHVEIKLPYSGKVAVVRRPTGRDMVEAERVAGEGAGRLAVALALASRVTSIDGRTMPYEDFLGFDADDLDAIREIKFDGEPLPFGQGDTPPTSSSPSQS